METTAATTQRPTFESLDANRDGFVARTELPADHALGATWADYDADNDARLGRSDFDRYLLHEYPSFADLDTNKDGTLTKAELPSAHALYQRFGSYDGDGDRKPSRSEFDAYVAGGGALAAEHGPGDEPEEEEAE